MTDFLKIAKSIVVHFAHICAYGVETVKLQATYSGLDIWVAFGMGKHFQYYHINTICQNLGEPLCQALPFYHAFTGCDATSQFLGKGKKSAWEAWKSLPNVTDAFQLASISCAGAVFSVVGTSHVFFMIEQLQLLR